MYGTRIIRCIVLSLMLWFGAFASAEAQQGNPFDLEHRVKQMTPKVEEDTVEQNPFDLPHRETKVPDAVPVEETNTNPFDIKRSTFTPPTEVPQEAATPVAPIVKSPPISSASEQSNFMFWSLLAMIILFALLLTLYRSFIGKIYRAFTNDNILRLLHREQGHFVTFPFLLLYLLFFINGGIFSFLVARHFSWVPHEFSILLYCMLGLGVIFLGKHIILKVVETIFPVSKEIRQYSFTIVIFSIILGVILIPFNILIAYAPPAIATIALYGALLAVLALYLFRGLRSLFIASKYLTLHKFHFFMYLCTVEIAPVLILLKLLLIKTGIQ